MEEILESHGRILKSRSIGSEIGMLKWIYYIKPENQPAMFPRRVQNNRQ